MPAGYSCLRLSADGEKTRNRRRTKRRKREKERKNKTLNDKEIKKETRFPLQNASRRQSLRTRRLED